MTKEFLEKNHDNFYFAMRVIVGLLFMQHGAQKLFGALGGTQQQLLSQMGLAGVIEFFGGLMLAAGLFTRIVAGIGGIEMLWAYFQAHAPNAVWPIANRGELALLYFAVFLIFLSHGAVKWGLDNYLFKE